MEICCHGGTSKWMLAVIYNDGSPRIVKMPIPKILPDHVLVKIYAAGANPADALSVFSDRQFDWSIFHSLTQKTVKSCVPGFDFSGVVVEVYKDPKQNPKPKGVNAMVCPMSGNPEPDLSCTMSREDFHAPPREETQSKRAPNFKVGDEVYGTVPAFSGTFCEYQVVPTSQLTLKPKSLSFVEAAATPYTGLTCLQAFHFGHVSKDSHLLVIGCSGGTGHFAVQYAKRLINVNRVVGICGTKNVDFVKNEMGADHVIDYRTQNWQLELQKELELFGPFDCVLDCVTSNKALDIPVSYEDYIRQDLVSNKKGHDLLLRGKYVRLAGPPSTWAEPKSTNSVIGGLNLDKSDLFWVRISNTREQLETLTDAIENHGLRPVISHELALGEEGVKKAFEVLRGRHTRGKVVLNLEKADEKIVAEEIKPVIISSKEKLAALFV